MRFLAIVLMVVLGGGLAPAWGAEPPTEIMIIVRLDSPPISLSVHDLRRLFGGGSIETETGQRLIPVNLVTRHLARQIVDRTILGLPPGQVGRYWVNRKIRGQGGPPRALRATATVAKFVASVPGVVGYLPAGPVPPGVRVLAVDGQLPGSSGYPVVADE